MHDMTFKGLTIALIASESLPVGIDFIFFVAIKYDYRTKDILLLGDRYYNEAKKVTNDIFPSANSLNIAVPKRIDKFYKLGHYLLNFCQFYSFLLLPSYFFTEKYLPVLFSILLHNIFSFHFIQAKT